VAFKSLVSHLILSNFSCLWEGTMETVDTLCWMWYTPCRGPNRGCGWTYSKIEKLMLSFWSINYLQKKILNFCTVIPKIIENIVNRFLPNTFWNIILILYEVFFGFETLVNDVIIVILQTFTTHWLLPKLKRTGIVLF
jgi:hypothetical protein